VAQDPNHSAILSLIINELIKVCQVNNPIILAQNLAKHINSLYEDHHSYDELHNYVSLINIFPEGNECLQIIVRDNLEGLGSSVAEAIDYARQEGVM
jgi:hypothetical protein